MDNPRGGLATPNLPTSNAFDLLSSNPIPGQSKKRFRAEPPTPDGKFLLIAHADPLQNLNKINPFIVMKALEGYTTELKQVTKLRNGTLLVETRNQRQADTLLKAKTLADSPIQVREHPTLNTVRGTIFSYDLLELDEQYLLDNLKEQKVVKVERVKKFNASRELVSTPAIILTFQGKTLPISIKAGYLLLRIKTYYPLPLKCKTCHKFGHSSKRCRGERLCASCGNPTHENECTIIKCINCTQHYPTLNMNAHSANDRNCMKFLEEKEIVKIMVDEQKMYNDARIKFNQLFPRTATTSTFAATLKTNNTQTSNKKFRASTSTNEPNSATKNTPSITPAPTTTPTPAPTATPKPASTPAPTPVPANQTASKHTPASTSQPSTSTYPKPTTPRPPKAAQLPKAAQPPKAAQAPSKSPTPTATTTEDDIIAISDDDKDDDDRKMDTTSTCSTPFPGFTASELEQPNWNYQ